MIRTQALQRTRNLLVAIGGGLALFNTAIAGESPAIAADDVAKLRAELQQLRSVTPSQSHAMIDVEYHFANLWFAAEAADWNLAGFYLNETRARVQWMWRIGPIRKLASGQDLELKPLVDAFESGGIAPLRSALDAHDQKAFATAYRTTLAQCFACHVAAEKPYLRPEIPRQPASPLINARH